MHALRRTHSLCYSARLDNFVADAFRASVDDPSADEFLKPWRALGGLDGRNAVFYALHALLDYEAPPRCTNTASTVAAFVEERAAHVAKDASAEPSRVAYALDAVRLRAGRVRGQARADARRLRRACARAGGRGGRPQRRPVDDAGLGLSDVR